MLTSESSTFLSNCSDAAIRQVRRVRIPEAPDSFVEDFREPLSGCIVENVTHVLASRVLYLYLASKILLRNHFTYATPADI
jgi:hypothetical protein